MPITSSFVPWQPYITQARGGFIRLAGQNLYWARKQETNRVEDMGIGTGIGKDGSWSEGGERAAVEGNGGGQDHRRVRRREVGVERKHEMEKAWDMGGAGEWERTGNWQGEKTGNGMRMRRGGYRLSGWRVQEKDRRWAEGGEGHGVGRERDIDLKWEDNGEAERYRGAGGKKAEASP